MRSIKFTCEIEVPFHEYKTKKLNKKAFSYIKRWLRDCFKNTSQLNFIPLYVEKDEDGCWIEDACSESKIKILKIEEK